MMISIYAMLKGQQVVMAQSKVYPTLDENEQTLEIERKKAKRTPASLSRNEEPLKPVIEKKVKKLSKEEFLEQEIERAKKNLLENELILCSPESPSLCLRNDFVRKVVFSEDQECVTRRQFCVDSLPQKELSEEELLNYISPNMIVGWLIFKEKLENYIKDPVLYGSNYYDKEYIERKKQELYRLVGGQ